MNTPAPVCVSVTANATFWDLYVASFVLLRYRWPLAIFFALFPLGGLFFLLTPLMGYRLGVEELLLGLGGLSYPLLIIALTSWILRRRNKQAKGPRTYTFDAEGMHVKGQTFSQTILWAGILRIRCTHRFLFVFISPSLANCIPLRAITDPEFIDHLRNIAATRTDFRA